MTELMNYLISYLLFERISKTSSFTFKNINQDQIETTEYMDFITNSIIHKLIHKKLFETDQVTNNNAMNLKRKRNKRGHYRKYESDQLSQAVHSVISGSMSVHRAGVFFKVPHSTLEYKVKERSTLNQVDCLY